MVSGGAPSLHENAPRGGSLGAVGAKLKYQALAWAELRSPAVDGAPRGSVPFLGAQANPRALRELRAMSCELPGAEIAHQPSLSLS